MPSEQNHRTFLTRHRRGLNITTVAVGQFFTGIFSLGLLAAEFSGLFGFLLWLFCTSALYFRLSYPRKVTAVVILTLATSLLNPYPLLGIWWCAPIIVYHWAKHGDARIRRNILTLAMLSSALGGFHFQRVFGYYQWSLIEKLFIWFVATFMCAAFCLICWFIGNTSRLSILRQQQLLERAQQLEFERDQERRLAIQDERSRIAREMHDIVAHSLSSVISQADGALYATKAQGIPAPQKLDLAETTFRTISDASRSALAQMRQLLGVLRTDEQALFSPLPSINDIDSLVDSMRANGFPISYHAAEEFDQSKLAPGADLVAYRVVQEALTNITKHAASTPHINVEVTTTREQLVITVENDAPTTPRSSIPGTGSGLIGMQERIDLYGGTLSSGTLLDGGFQVVATLPFSLSQGVSS